MPINVKYEKEVRFGLGVVVIKLQDTSIIGWQVPAFEHTKNTSIAEKDYIMKELNNMQAIRNGTEEGRGDLYKSSVYFKVY